MALTGGEIKLDRGHDGRDGAAPRRCDDAESGPGGGPSGGGDDGVGGDGHHAVVPRAAAGEDPRPHPRATMSSWIHR